MPHDRRVNRRRRSVLPCLVLGLPLLLAGAVAQADGDQDRARTAVRAGEVMPLKTLLERLEAEHPGRLLDVELERESGRWVYEVRLLQPDGRLVKLEVDAATGQVLRRKERSRRSEPRP